MGSVLPRPRRKEHIKRHRNRAEADRWLASVKADMQRGECVEPRLARTTFDEWAEEWLSTIAHLRPKTRVGYESALRVHVLPVFGNRPIGSIQQVDVRRFVAEKVASGAAPGTVRGARKVLRLVLNTAVGSGAIRSNPCNGVRVPASPKAEMVYLTAEEGEALAQAIDPRYATLVRFAAYTGLRAGEICALPVGRLDLLRGRVLVEESVTEVERHGLVFSEPKTYERRSVTLPRFLREELSAHLAGRAVEPDHLVFPAASSGVLRHKRFYRTIFKPAVVEAGLPAQLRFHDPRHTCASLCIALGAHPKAIQERLGHSSITVTLDRYGHLFPRSTRRSPTGSTRCTARRQSRRLARGLPAAASSVRSGAEMSTHPTQPEPGGHLDLPVDELLARAQLWGPADEPALDDLTDDEEADFLGAIAG